MEHMVFIAQHMPVVSSSLLVPALFRIHLFVHEGALYIYFFRSSKLMQLPGTQSIFKIGNES